MHRILTPFLFIAAGIAVAGITHASPFRNGSFEDGPRPGLGRDASSRQSGFVVTLSTGDTDLAGWVVTAGDIDYMDGAFWQASDGDYSLDLSGTQAGSIAQTFDTQPGTSYEVIFALAGNPDGGVPAVKVLRVLATGGVAVDYSFAPQGHSTSAMGWVDQTYTFTATGASTTLSFTSLANANSGPALDNVRVRGQVVVAAAIPVPAAAWWALLALIGGLLGVVWHARRDAIG